MIKRLPSWCISISWQIIRNIGFGPWILRWHPKSYLRTSGWFRSFKGKRPVNILGEPIPWLTYPFIHFIEPRIHNRLRVFEYGCGHSTIWFANRVGEIISVEHNKEWADEIARKVPDNGKVIFSDIAENYVKMVNENGLFDIIIIDGLHRDRCWQNALIALKEGGVIIWDNSNLDEYQDAIQSIHNHGFKEIVFHGLVPGNFIAEQTSILYQSINCIGL